MFEINVEDSRARTLLSCKVPKISPYILRTTIDNMRKDIELNNIGYPTHVTVMTYESGEFNGEYFTSLIDSIGQRTL